MYYCEPLNISEPVPNLKNFQTFKFWINLFESPRYLGEKMEPQIDDVA